MNKMELSHLAGVVDAAGVITCHVMKGQSMSIGYALRPMIRIHRPKEDEILMGKIMEYCDERGVQYSIEEKNGERSASLRFTATKVVGIKRFLEPLLPYLTQRYEDAVLMHDHLVPAYLAQEQLERDGFYQMVGIADELRGSKNAGTDSKYTQEYFEDEWDDLDTDYELLAGNEE